MRELSPEQLEHEFDVIMTRLDIQVPESRRAGTLAVVREQREHLRILWTSPVTDEPAPVFTVEPVAGADGQR